MEKLLESAASQVPGLIVLAVIVKWFLAYMVTRDRFLAELNADHLRARRESREVILAATVVMQEVRDTLQAYKVT